MTENLVLPRTVSVVIPVYNEKSTIEEILRRVQAAQVQEVILVDDCSKDGTREILEDLAARQERGESAVPILGGRAQLDLRTMHIFFQPKNQGKGAAVRRGFAAVTCDIVIVQDADLEYDPRDYPKMLEPIFDGRADVVYGSRFLGGPQRVLYFWHYAGNKVLTLLSNMCSNLNFTDMETCYKICRREVLAGLKLKCNGFGFDPEFTARIAKGTWRIYEVPISYAGRTYAEGKKITWKDGFRALYQIVRFNLFD